ncbi:exodeoxyribonuclease VII large subunit [Spiroplasma alleghenense]|uniref:Exodeoxyribonuclease 7 large subunit n=1 Tax=Spiroplasma alleghenense TaxID=216931 RepID=A0A345Z3J4_9MOLU|nr:exodeoxyribonuclease VII large subunit [Spiroplasma alleghenense]AXK51173.1 exodeoxyribonuclease VII large subunit [Spiroplasma alleghenense]
MEEKALSVTELNNFIKRNLESNEYLKNINVTGELSNLTFNKSGHIYFSIKDEGSAISCMIWKDKSILLKSLNPKEGMNLTVTGRVTYYVPNGKTNFEVVDIKLDGFGQLHLLYNERKIQLENLGWFDKSIKKTVPNFPKNIGIVTASTGAAVQDLIKTISRRYPQANVYVFPTLVQGEQAQFDIANKIKQANNFEKKLDVLIVGRGGGSYEDLWSFNEMPVLEAIRDSIIPTISAVGHEPDFTLSDYVADLRAATPTAAAEIATPSIEELKRALENYEAQISKGIIKKHNDFKKELRNYYQNSIKSFKNKFLNFDREFHLISKNLIQIINSKIKSIDDFLDNSLNQQYFKIKNKIEWNEVNLNHFNDKIKLLNPLKPLEKGFAIVRNKDNQILRSINEISAEKIVSIEMRDGIINTKTE